MDNVEESGFHCLCTALKDTKGVIYILAPRSINISSMHSWANELTSNIVELYGTPADEISHQKTLSFLKEEVFPTIEKALGYAAAPMRSLIGIQALADMADWAKANDPSFKCVSSIRTEPFEHQLLQEFDNIIKSLSEPLQLEVS